MDLPNRVPIPNNREQRPTNEQELQHSGRIPYFTFRVSVKANRYALELYVFFFFPWRTQNLLTN